LDQLNRRRKILKIEHADGVDDTDTPSASADVASGQSHFIPLETDVDDKGEIQNDGTTIEGEAQLQ
jgi:hypothetical protein